VGAATTEYHEVDSWQEVSAPTKAFPGNPLEAIAVHSEACTFLRDRKTEASASAATGPGENGKKGVARGYGIGKDAVEIGRTQEA